MDTDDTPVDQMPDPVAPEAELTTPPPDPEPEPQPEPEPEIPPVRKAPKEIAPEPPPFKVKAGVNFSIDGGSVSAL